MNSRVKIDRAKHHLADLEEAIRLYHRSNPYKIITDTQSDPGNVIFRFHYTIPIPIEWGGIVGDIIHNLRASLDNLATSLAIQNGRTSNNVLRNTYFPIGASKQSFDDLCLRYLRGASSDAIRITQRLKPYKGGADTLWQIHQLDIIDKHSALIPVGTGSGVVRMKFPTPKLYSDTEVIPADCIPPEMPPLTARLNKRYPLKNGDVLMKIQHTASALKIGADGDRIDMAGDGGEKYPDLQFSFSVAFGQGQVVDGDAVVPTLKKFIDFTERTIDIFARRVFQTTW